MINTLQRNVQKCFDIYFVKNEFEFPDVHPGVEYLAEIPAAFKRLISVLQNGMAHFPGEESEWNGRYKSVNGFFDVPEKILRPIVDNDEALIINLSLHIIAKFFVDFKSKQF